MLLFLQCVCALCVCSSLSCPLINCSSSGYPAFHCPVRPCVRQLDLSHNALRRVSRTDFRRLRQLRRLLLRSNLVSSVDRRAFRGNPLLEYLDLSDNRLRNLGSVPLQNLPHLRVLDLRWNPGPAVDLRGWRDACVCRRACVCASRLRVLRLGHPGVMAVARLHVPAGSLDTLHLVTGELLRYDGSLRACPARLRSAVLELHSRRHPEAVRALLRDLLLLNATRSLTLAGLRLSRSEPFRPPGLARSALRRLVLRNVTLAPRHCQALLSDLLLSRVETVVVETVAVETPAADGPPPPLPARLRCVSAIPAFRRSRLKRVRVRDVDGAALYGFAPEARLVKFLWPLERLALVSAGLSLVPCLVSQSLGSLRELDLSSNSLELFGLSPGCVRPFPRLEALRLDGNSLRSLAGLARETHHMTRLELLSANYNSLGAGVAAVSARGPSPEPDLVLDNPEPSLDHTDVSLDGSMVDLGRDRPRASSLETVDVGASQWTLSLRLLHLRGNRLTSADLPLLPDTLEMLDLSHNLLTSLWGLPGMPHLTHLYLSHNRLRSLATLLSSLPGPPPLLSSLHEEANALPAQDPTLLAALGRVKVRLGRNPFQCDCRLILQLVQQCLSHCPLVDWPGAYHCHEPPALRGTEVQSAALRDCGADVVPVLSAVAAVVLSLLTLMAPCAVLWRWRKRRLRHIN